MQSIRHLEVPGASLHYEIRGAGPLLLLICGGVYDAAGYADLAERLADRHTVITYDRRGNSRSPLAGPPAYQRIEVHADDAHRLLADLGATPDEPADVFGNSSGAMIGLELATRHPEQLRTLVAHEPPIFELLDDRDRFRAVLRDVEQALSRDDPAAAMGVLGAGLQMSGGESSGERVPGGAEAPHWEPDPQTLAMLARMEKNMDFFIRYEVPPFATYVPDLAALRTSSVRVVAAAGAASRGEPPNRAAIALAERLGTQPAIFPGDHGGFGNQVDDFAATLRRVLSR